MSKVPIPENHVLLPKHSRVFARDYTIRQIRCETCNTILCGLTIDEEHEAKFVWPFRVECRGKEHGLIPRKADEAANAICYGVAADDFDVERFLGEFLLPEQKVHP